MFVPHATLLRGTLYMLWRENEKALQDLEMVLNMQGVSEEVKKRNMCGKRAVSRYLSVSVVT